MNDDDDDDDDDDADDDHEDKDEREERLEPASAAVDVLLFGRGDRRCLRRLLRRLQRRFWVRRARNGRRRLREALFLKSKFVFR